MKYLGITIEDNRDIFRKHKQNKLKLAEQLANSTYSVINKSCNKMIIGKTFWKSIAIPAIIYGSGTIDWTKKEQEKLQVLQNKVCRKILSAPSWAANAAIRGETGISKMETRLAQNRLGYVRNRRREGNDIIKVVVNELTNEGKWKKTIEKNCEEIEYPNGNLINLTKTELKRKIRKWDTGMWKEEMTKKSTLQIYRLNKKEIKEEEYDNDQKSEIWFRGKTNCMKLADRNWEGSKECKLCGADRENLNHFLLHCVELSNRRVEDLSLQKPNIEDENEIISKFFFCEERTQQSQNTLHRLWRQRANILKGRDRSH